MKKTQKWQKELSDGDKIIIGGANNTTLEAIILNPEGFGANSEYYPKAGYILTQVIGHTSMTWMERRHVISKIN